MKVKFTKNVPATILFKDIDFGDVFCFEGEEDVFIKIPEVENIHGEPGNAIDLRSGELVVFPSDCGVIPVKHKLLIYED